jgi:hypothetical protein
MQLPVGMGVVESLIFSVRDVCVGQMSDMTKKAKAGRLFPAVVLVLILLAVTTVNLLTPLVHADVSPVSRGDIIVADFSAHAVFR